MKLLRKISHPYVVIVSFFAIMISGEQVGGFYILYVLAALRHGEIYSIFSISGVFLLLIVFSSFRSSKTKVVKISLNILAIIMLSLSLFSFFYSDKIHYNYGTFTQVVPLTSFILFIVIAVCFLIDNVLTTLKIGA